MKAPLIVVAAAMLLIARPAGAEGQMVPKPSQKDKCPVCGMFVFKYPDWVAALRFKDGTYRYFDGSKDLFKFLSGLKHYAPGKGPADIDRYYVTDYYALKQIDGRTAYYVVGSDVYGPMGKELVPFEQEPEAREFLKDHKGRAILRSADVTAQVLQELD